MRRGGPPPLRIVGRPARTWHRRPMLVVTDLDGSLLDEAYDFEPARPALAALAAAGIPLVLASSKTRAEMERIAKRLRTRSPLIVENGGAILLPDEDSGFRVLARGVPHARLRRALEEIGRETSSALRGFSSFTPQAIVTLTGLDQVSATFALTREHDEPFVMGDETKAAAVAAAAESRGLRVTRGGRFFHLTGAIDKGDAFRELVRLMGRPAEIIGLGDALNDLSLLAAVDRPIVVPRAGGELDADLSAALPHAEVAPAPGPVGWNAAVMVVLAGGRLPTVSGGDAA